MLCFSLFLSSSKKINNTNQGFFQRFRENYENHRENKNALNTFCFRDDSSIFEKKIQLDYFL